MGPDVPGAVSQGAGLSSFSHEETFFFLSVIYFRESMHAREWGCR